MRPLVPLSALAFHGRDLCRPECVLAHRSGLLFAADWTEGGGVALVDPRTDRVVRHLVKDRAAPLRPNGIWLEEDGSFLLAHLGDTDGGVFRLYPDGRSDSVLQSVGETSLPPTNFAMRAPSGNLYVTVSTRRSPRHAAAHPGTGDGFIVLVPPGGEARIVADNLGYTNECAMDPSGTRLVVNETFGRRTSAFAVFADGSLGERETVAEYGHGFYPDGIVFDAEGGIVITSIISNTVLRIAPDGTRSTWMEDRDEARVETVEARYLSGELDHAVLSAPHGGPLANISSLAFAGPSLQTAVLGCLLGTRLASFPAPLPGARPPFYDVDLAPLQRAGLIPSESMDTNR